MSLLGNLFGQQEDLRKERIGGQVCIFVDVGDDRSLVERRKRVVHLLQFRFDFIFQVFFRLVRNLVDGSEHDPLVGLVGRLFPQNQYGTYNQYHEERELPSELFVCHIQIRIKRL